MTAVRQPISLLIWDGEPPDAFTWPHGPVDLVASLPGLRAALDGLIAENRAGWVLCWNMRLGPPPAARVAELITGRGDAYHAGLSLGAAGQPGDLDLVHPTWYFTVDPTVDTTAVSWRLTLDALLVRVDVLRQLGGLDPVFTTPEAAGLDLGWRLLSRGALPLHSPRLSDPLQSQMLSALFDLSLLERYILLARHLAPKWVRYVGWRRAFRSLRPDRELGAMRRGTRAARALPSLPTDAQYRRASPSTPAPQAVSVVLPTLGRYELVGNVLDDLRRQTVPAVEIICVDQTHPHDPKVFEPHQDLPLTVIPQAGLGQWLARNEALSRVRHDLILFLDDDSQIPPEFIEKHLACLADFGADISAGASLSIVGAPTPANYSFYRAADQFDSGNALVRRDLLTRVGAFDRQFDRMRSGDAEFGLRAHLTGAISIHNPDAYRVHYKAAEGGLRSFGSWDLFRQRGWFSPLPLPSVLYFAMRYFSPRQQRENLLIGLAAGIIPYERKRRASLLVWARYGSLAVLTAPLHAARVLRSVHMARRMVADGPRIPGVEAVPTESPG